MPLEVRLCKRGPYAGTELAAGISGGELATEDCVVLERNLPSLRAESKVSCRGMAGAGAEAQVYCSHSTRTADE